jgi:small-conductance mechanosensitive channel
LIRNLGDNGIDLDLTVWISDAEEGQGSLRSEIYLELLIAFKKEGIEIPFPQREIRLTTSSEETVLATKLQGAGQS